MRRGDPWKRRADRQPARLFGLVVSRDAGRRRLVRPRDVVLGDAVMTWHFSRHHGLKQNGSFQFQFQFQVLSGTRKITYK